MKDVIIDTSTKFVPMITLVFKKSLELTIEMASCKPLHRVFFHGKWFMFKLEVSTLGNLCDAIALYDFAQSSCSMLLSTKFGFKNELASLLNKTMLSKEDNIFRKIQVPMKDEKLSCFDKNGTFC